MSAERTNGRREVLDVVAYSVPPLAIVALLVTFLIAPDFYLRYLLQHDNREGQVVEIVTNLCSAGALLMLYPSALRVWRATVGAGGSRLAGGPVFMLLGAMAATVFLGEELSWGQTVFRWKTPNEFRGFSPETNLHNGVMSQFVHVAGSTFIFVQFVLLPVAWRLRNRLPVRLPDDWRSGIPDWPVMSCALLALLVKLIKTAYMLVVSDPAVRATSRFWNDYLGEISEQKEMLVGMTLLLYGIYRFRAILVRKETFGTPG